MTTVHEAIVAMVEEWEGDPERAATFPDWLEGPGTEDVDHFMAKWERIISKAVVTLPKEGL